MNDYSIIDNYKCDFKYDYLNDVINHTLEVESVKNASFSVILINDNEMHKLNKEYRGIDRTTDVLSFALEDNQNYKSEIRCLGDIFVSIDKAKVQANEYKHSIKRELSFLVCHGLLHLLGYDHTKSKEEENRQFTLQDNILNDLGIID